jgi:hypothetical protein
MRRAPAVTVALSALGAMACAAPMPAPAPRPAFGWAPPEYGRCGGVPCDARKLRGVPRTLATGAWNHDLPRTVARTLPRSIRRAVAGVRRPLRPEERAVLGYFGGVAPARRKRQRHQGQSERGHEPTHSDAVNLHGVNIGQNVRGGQSA